MLYMLEAGFVGVTAFGSAMFDDPIPIVWLETEGLGLRVRN